MRDERTPPRIRELLSEVPAIKAYGEKGGLKPTSNYTEYVSLDRPAAVWVVSACEPLRFESKEWSFPVLGGFPYLGWFDRSRAERFAENLREEGWDVDVRGARAYSTLGWFRDSILSTMIPEGEEALGDLVNVVLHESVHATYYVKGQAMLNESVASFVADRLTPEYLERSRGASSAQLKAYLESEKASESRARAMTRAYSRLQALYASRKSDEEKRAEKASMLEALSREVGARRPLNNATLVQFKTYGTGMAEFEKLYLACGKDWGRFWRAMRKVDRKSFRENHQEDLGSVLLPLVREGCP